MSVEQILFWVFAVAVVGSSALVITARSPINSAMGLVATFFFLAGIYVLLWAHTIAILQILVYAGAIMVLFLFVIMLLSLGDSEAGTRFTLSRIVGGLAAAALLVFLVIAIQGAKLDPPATMSLSAQSTFGTLAHMGQTLYTVYLLPFEAVSLLLLVAIVGAVVVAKSRI